MGTAAVAHLWAMYYIYDIMRSTRFGASCVKIDDICVQVIPNNLNRGDLVMCLVMCLPTNMLSSLM